MTLVCAIHGAIQPPGGLPSWRRIVSVTSWMSARSSSSHAGVGSLRVGAAVGDDLVAARAHRRHHLRAVIIDGGVDQMIAGELELVEQLEQPPHADAVAVIAPTVVAVVGRRGLRGDEMPEALPEGEMLDVQGDVNGEALALGPGIIRPLGDGRVIVASVRRQLHGVSPLRCR